MSDEHTETPSAYLRGFADDQETLGEELAPAQLRRCADFMDELVVMLELCHTRLTSYSSPTRYGVERTPSQLEHAIATLLKESKGQWDERRET